MVIAFLLYVAIVFLLSISVVRAEVAQKQVSFNLRILLLSVINTTVLEESTKG